MKYKLINRSSGKECLLYMAMPENRGISIPSNGIKKNRRYLSLIIAAGVKI
jgi:hypothetical protein